MKSSPALMAATVLMLSGALLASYAGSNRLPHALVRQLDNFPTSIDGWTASPGRVPGQRELELLTATSYLSRNYTRSGHRLELFIAYYALQKAGESMHTPKNCLPAAGWEILNYGEANIPFDGKSARVNDFKIQNGDARAVVIYWYQTADRVIANEYAGKGFLLWDAISKGRTDGAMVRINAEDGPDADQDLRQFARSVLEEVKISFGS